MRQFLNLVLPPLMWLCSSMNLISGGARSPSAMSDANPSLLVPSGIAFSIWLPIFVLCITYGVIQFLPKNKNHPVFKAIGWWTIAGFIGVCAWGLVNAYWPMKSVQMATAIVFIPTMLLLVAAMFKFASARLVHDDKFPFAFAGVSMIAGWCSIAVFLNWAPQTVRWMRSGGMSISVSSAIVLSLALLWIAVIAWRTRGNIAYVIPPIWGLAWLLVKRLNAEAVHTDIIAVAGIGIVVLLILTFLGRKRGVV